MLLEQEFNAAVVVLSFAVSFLGAFIAVSICEHLRLSLIEDNYVSSDEIRKNTLAHKRDHFLYLILMSLTISVVGIWGMHFIGMQALRLYIPADKNPSGENHRVMVDMTYSILLSLSSLIVVTFMTAIGTMIASYDVMFSKTKQEIIEAFITDAKTLPMSEIRKISSRRILWIISTKSVWRLVLGGIFTGGGVSVMHYIGMAAMRVHYGGGEAVQVYNPGLVFLSVLIAIVAATAAFWILFRLLSIFPERESLRQASAVIMAIAVTGMHYTGMTAVQYDFKPQHEVDSIADTVVKWEMSNVQSFQACLVSANIVLWLFAGMLIITERRRMGHYQRFVRQADQIITKLVTADRTSTSDTTADTIAVRSVVDPPPSFQLHDTASVAEGSQDGCSIDSRLRPSPLVIRTDSGNRLDTTPPRATTNNTTSVSAAVSSAQVHRLAEQYLKKRFPRKYANAQQHTAEDDASLTPPPSDPETSDKLKKLCHHQCSSTGRVRSFINHYIVNLDEVSVFGRDCGNNDESGGGTVTLLFRRGNHNSVSVQRGRRKYTPTPTSVHSHRRVTSRGGVNPTPVSMNHAPPLVMSVPPLTDNSLGHVVSPTLIAEEDEEAGSGHRAQLELQSHDEEGREDDEVDGRGGGGDATPAQESTPVIPIHSAKTRSSSIFGSFLGSLRALTDATMVTMPIMQHIEELVEERETAERDDDNDLEAGSYGERTRNKPAPPLAVRTNSHNTRVVPVSPSAAGTRALELES